MCYSVSFDDCVFVVCFFFKQKTAYEMRISDWSSDVCSSDLIMPDGRSIVLERLPGADGAGFAGLQDGVNQHWGNLLKAAAVSTLLGLGAELGADSEDDLTRALRRGSQDTISQTGQQIVRRQLNVQPTLTIRPGHPLRVVITSDLVLRSEAHTSELQ